jgi:hypothetical protein
MYRIISTIPQSRAPNTSKLLSRRHRLLSTNLIQTHSQENHEKKIVKKASHPKGQS